MDDKTTAGSKPKNEPTIASPSISLPKGGGAIQGIGEKFSANPVTGTGSMSVPIAVSPGRTGFAPQLLSHMIQVRETVPSDLVGA